MRRPLIFFPIALITFAVGLFVSFDRMADNGTGSLGLKTPFRNAVWGSKNLKLSENLYGKWGGPGGDVFDIREGTIRDIELQKTFAYRMLRHVDNQSENGYLLQVLDLSNGSNLRNFIYFRFSDDGWVAYYGYNSMDDFYQSRYTALGNFSR